MKNFTLICLMLAVAALFAACGGAANTNTAGGTTTKPAAAPPTQEDLMALDKKANQAWFDHDTKYFETFLSDNFVGFGAKRWDDKAAALKEIAEHKCEVKSFQLNEPKMQMAGPDVAIMTYKATYDGTCDGKKIPDSRVASVFVRKADLWLGAYHSETPIVASAGATDKKTDANKVPADAKKITSPSTSMLALPSNASKPAGNTTKAETAANKPANTTDANTTEPAAAPPIQVKNGDNVKPSADEALLQALTQIEVSGWEAWKAKDAAKLDELTTPNVMLIDSMGNFAPDKQAALKAWAAPCTVSSVSVTEPQAVSVTAEVGMLTYKGTAAGTCGSQKLNPVWGLTLFLREGSIWKAAFIAEMPVS